MELKAELHPDTVVSQAKSLKFTKLDDEMLAIDAEAGHCYSLNETAGQIWEHLASPLTLGELCGRLEKANQVDPEICRNDTTELLQKLQGAGLVKFDNKAL